MQKTKILFVHIPKCGGSTIIETIRKNMQLNKFIYAGNPDQNIFFNKIADISDYNFIGGHFSYPSFVDKIGPTNINKFFVFTLLRDPIDRVISLFKYIQRNKKHPRHYQVQNMSFNNFIKSKFYISNLQCFFISGEKNHQIAIDFLIKKFDLYGTTNNINNFLQKLFMLFDINEYKIVNKNISNTKYMLCRDNLDSSSLEILHEKESEDILLYQKIQIYLSI